MMRDDSEPTSDPPSWASPPTVDDEEPWTRGDRWCALAMLILFVVIVSAVLAVCALGRF